MPEVLLDLAGIIVQALRSNSHIRIWSLASSGFLLVLIAVVQLTAIFWMKAEAIAVVMQSIPFVAIPSGIVFLLSLLAFTPVKIQGGGTVRAELESIREERYRIEERLATQKDPDVLDTIHLNLNQLNEYYTINKSQARSSFRFSVFAIVVGLAMLIFSIWMFALQRTSTPQIAVITGISGVLSQFIGGAYFYLYRTSLIQLNYFFHQLVRMQDTMLSVRLCDQMSNQERQNILREKVALILLERSSLTAGNSMKSSVKK
ncbi:TRADD-N-associated membrane domain-containing protein [Nodosilinea sp. PGN35]|uniref:TRADD-N-associated membrane domain-containing protein n=1 Tax=Nodosilinea sp. PGN35 TaxID=3020489 RepID=UPI0023B2DD00|nr:hypothetical protein [Nodosilinea sp. TSF1-S3]MDF0365698.1 hypothetical protein [Nodosilinea sp. TSF1-S3]